MLKTSKTFRPTIENLETREVLAASILGHAALFTPARVATHQPVMQVQQGTNGVRSLVGMQSLISITNTTGAAINFTLQWSGSSVARSYSVPAGQTWKFWNSSAGSAWNPSARSATIRFDYSYASGYQGKTYSLSSKLAVESASGGAPVGNGQGYVFRTLGNGIELYRKA